MGICMHNSPTSHPLSLGGYRALPELFGRSRSPNRFQRSSKADGIFEIEDYVGFFEGFTGS